MKPIFRSGALGFVDGMFINGSKTSLIILNLCNTKKVEG